MWDYHKQNEQKNKAEGDKIKPALNHGAKQRNKLTKKETMLKTFIKLGRRDVNCFEAVNLYHDYVLRTTISDLRRDYGINFARKWEKVPNGFGKTTDCKRYWLDESNIKKALAVLDDDEAVGGAQ